MDSISNSADVKVFASLNIFPSPRLCKVKGGGGDITRSKFV